MNKSLPPALAALSLSLSLLASPAEAQTLHAWGSDLQQQLSTEPTVAFAQVEGGGAHSVGLGLDGSVYSWGLSYKPVVKNSPAGNDFLQVGAGLAHSIALRSDGSLVCWGDDSYGEVSGAPTGTGFKFVSVGGHFSLALRNDGSIQGWGDDYYGQVSTAPTGTGYVEISAGQYHAIARQANGTLISWGRNNHGQVTLTPSGSDFVQVSAGLERTLALRSNGYIESWGKDSYSVVSTAPKTGGFKDIAAGQYTDMALAFDGSIVAWGSDGFGVISSAPTGAGYDDISVGTVVGMALLSDCNGNGLADTFDIATGTSTDFDGNLLPDECSTPALYADRFDLSVATGGVQTFSLDAGEDYELRVYLLLGSTSGTSPGLPVADKLLPLVLDSYLTRTLMAPNHPPLAGSFGVLSAKVPGPGGRATATLTLPPAFDPILVGVTLHHAFLVVEPSTGYPYFVSNPVPTALFL